MRMLLLLTAQAFDEQDDLVEDLLLIMNKTTHRAALMTMTDCVELRIKR